jgi:hypothetical protein
MGEASLVKVNAWSILLYELGGEAVRCDFCRQEKHIAVERF